ncbi:MAG: hypothetical protein ABR875_03460 [Minisyncoccia bacterium]|jgi:Na+/glutamate symporter
MEIGPIDPDSWHAKLYFWCLALWAKFRSGSDGEYYFDIFTEKTNLCLYIRAIVIWMPLVILLHLLLLACAIYALLIPFRTFGWSYIYFCLSLAIVVGSVAGLMILLKRRNKDKAKPEPKNYYAELLMAEHERERKRALKAKKSPSFMKIMIAWIKSKKAGICPMIFFAKSEGGSHGNQ